jgi:hypothetical protein
VVTARSESKANDFAERRFRFKELLEVVITGDLTAVGAFDDLAKDVDVIIHCANVSHSIPLHWLVGTTPRTQNAYPLLLSVSTLAKCRP